MNNSSVKLNWIENKNINSNTLLPDDISLEKTRLYIEAIDFSMIIDKMINTGWLKTDAEKTCKLYRNYLFLNKKYGSKLKKLAPSKDIDEFWHYHILDTKKYHNDCENIFGYYLHHQPSYPGSNYNFELEELSSIFKEIQNFHFHEYGEYIEATKTSRPRIINYILSSYFKYRNALVRNYEHK